MIEINLLPTEHRQAEGTPLPRLLSIIVGMVLAAVGLLFMANYYMVEIPRKNQEIEALEHEKKDLEKVKKRVAELEAEKARYLEKVNSLRTLENSRIRWARVLDRLRASVPKEGGCVLRRFSYRPDMTPAPPGAVGGKRYNIQLTGTTSGGSELECRAKLLLFKEELMRNLQVAPPKPAKGEAEAAEKTAAEGPGLPLAGAAEKVAGAPAAGAPGQAPAKGLPAGYSEFLGLRFEEPFVENYRMLDKGPPKPRDPKLEKLLPPKGLEFLMSISFSLPPPVGKSKI
jgi:Tfp pilus assembly protein PilN